MDTTPQLTSVTQAGQVIKSAIGEIKQYLLNCDLSTIKDHQTRPYALLFIISTPLSSIMQTCDDYALASTNLILVPNSEHKKLLEAWSNVCVSITDILDLIPDSADTTLGDTPTAKPCKYKNTVRYDPSMDEIAQAIFQNRPNIGRFIRNTCVSITQRLQSFVDLSSRQQPADKWVNVLQHDKAAYAKSREGKASMKSYQHDVLNDLKKEDVKKEKSTLYTNHKDNPIVRLHKKLHSDPEEFVYKLREGNFSQENLKDFYDYAMKLDALLDIQNPHRMKSLMSVPPVDQEHLNKKVVSDGLKAWELFQAVGGFFATNEEELSQKIDPSTHNQLFIIYYLLFEMNLLEPGCTVQDFVDQLSAWYPNFVPNDQKKKDQIIGSIYAEKRNWTDDKGLMPRYCDLQNFVANATTKKGSKLKARKASQFRTKMQACYIVLNNLRKKWRE